MTAVSTYSPTGDPYLNGILSGVKWGVGSLTFSFPTDASFYGTSYAGGEQTSNFQAFNAVQQAATRAVLLNYAAVANLTFTEVTETATQHGELRYAESDKPGTAWAYYPSSNAAGGDAWFNNSGHYYDSPARGNYAYLTLLHETGHAMGLKHPQDASGAFAAMPADKDSVEYTVMSYRSYIGGPTTGYTLGSSSFPQTLMMYDILALQTLYGANYATNAGDTVYKWNPLNGQMSVGGVLQTAPNGNKVFLTVWDGGGRDTYDFSNYATNLTVSLEPGAWSTLSTTQLASLGSGHYAAGNIANALLFQGNTASLIEDAIGGSGSDSITGNTADNRLTGNAGNDTLDGAGGSDTAVYSGLRANYSLTQNADGSWTIVDGRVGSPDGTDLLKNIELVQFADLLQSVGGSVPPPPPPPANTAPTATSPAQLASLTEWADLSAAELANTPHNASGAITYADPDSADVHTAAFTARGTGYLGSFSLSTANIDSADSVGWSFSVSDSAMDSLGAGQSVVQYYDVTIADGHGGALTQAVAITLNGASDPVVVVVNSVPVAANDAYSVAKNGRLSIAVGAGVLVNDSDSSGANLSALLVGKTSHGTLTLLSDGSFSYRPDKNYIGTDSFSYKVSNGTATSNIATVVLGVVSGKGNGAGSSYDDNGMTDDQAPAWHPERDLAEENLYALHGLNGLSGPGYHAPIVDYFAI